MYISPSPANLSKLRNHIYAVVVDATSNKFLVGKCPPPRQFSTCYFKMLKTIAMKYTNNLNKPTIVYNKFSEHNTYFMLIKGWETVEVQSFTRS